MNRGGILNLANLFLKAKFLLLLAGVSMVVCAGCGGSKPGVSASSKMTFAAGELAPPPFVALSDTVAFAAVLADDRGGLGINWKVNCVPGKAKGADCGSITPHTASGFPTSYAAPRGDVSDAIPAGGSVSVTATSATEPSQSATINIQIVLKPVQVGFAVAPPPSMITGASVNLLVVNANDPNRTGADLALTCAGRPVDPSGSLGGNTGGSPGGSPGGSLIVDCGTIGRSHVSGDNTTYVTYTAPTIVPGVPPLPDEPPRDPNLPDDPTKPQYREVFITATATADPTKSVFAKVTITQAPVKVTISQQPLSDIRTGASTVLAALVDFDIGNLGVDWTATCGIDDKVIYDCGSFSPVQTESGALTTYTAPASVPPGDLVTITATSITDPTKRAATVVQVTPGDVRNDLLNGRYAFLLTGVNADGFTAIGGTLTADGVGHVTSASESILGDQRGNGSPSGAYSLSGTYFIGSDGRGTITLNNAPSSMGYWYNGQQIFKITIVDSNHTEMEEFDGYFSDLRAPYGGSLQGTLELQKPAPSLAGQNSSYSFVAAGADSQKQPSYYGGTISASSFLMDRSLGGKIDSVTGVPGFNDASGDPSRGIVVFGNYEAAYYVVDAGHFIFVTIHNQDDKTGDLPAGHVFVQPSTVAIPAGKYAFTGAGFAQTEQASLPQATAGWFNCDGSGSANGFIDANEQGSVSSVSVSGTCAMSSSGTTKGRGSLSWNNGVARRFNMYPTANRGILLLQLDPQKSGIGIALPQSTVMDASKLSGTYVGRFQRLGSIQDSIGVVGAEDSIGLITADGSSKLLGTVDVDVFDRFSFFWKQVPDAILWGNVLPDLQGRLTGSFTTTDVETSQQKFYLVDDSTVLSLETDTTPGTGVLKLQKLN